MWGPQERGRELHVLHPAPRQREVHMPTRALGAGRFSLEGTDGLCR